jgi:hypothetical protein
MMADRTRDGARWQLGVPHAGFRNQPRGARPAAAQQGAPVADAQSIRPLAQEYVTA